jgi:hypothetical protein
MTGDGTVKGRMQTFVSYGMSLTAFLLAILTIFTTTYSLTSDVKDKQVYTVLTKPIRRFQFVLGKLLGIIILDAGLLVLFSGIIYGITILLPKVLHADEAQMAQLQNEFFTARTSIKPENPDISQELDQAYKKLKLNGEVPAGVDENPAARHNYMNELGRRIGLRRRAAAVGEELLLVFNNVKPKDPNIFIRFKYDVAVNPQDLSIYSRWVVGDDRPYRLAATSDTPIYSLERKDAIRTFREFLVPAAAVAGDGYLAVAFLNVPLNNTSVIFPFEDGIELLYKADTFTANFTRAVLLIFVRLVFLAALAVFAGSFLSFPVAILLCMAVFTMANMSGFIGESFDVVSGNVSPVYTWFLQPMLLLMPHFDKFDPSQFLVPARLLSWYLLAWISFTTLCIRALLLVILSLVIFTYREIAKVIV